VVAGGAALAVGLAVGTAAATAAGLQPVAPGASVTAASNAPPPAPEAEVSPAETAPEPIEEAGRPSDQRHFDRVDRITGGLTPKSVVASGHGLVVAQNMIYTHTVSAFSSSGDLLATIDDRITPSDWGLPGDSAVEGGPVEAAFSKDGSQLWVSNYSMYGPGFDSPGGDTCNPDQDLDHSYLYRIDTETLEIADVVEVGAVPKFVDVTPDGRHVLVTNWCTWDLSIVSTGVDGAEPTEVARVPIGRYPRGIAVSPDSTTAYVAVMGAEHLAVVDIDGAVAGEGEDAVTRIDDVGDGPRHLNISPDGSTLYATLNADGKVAKVDVASGEVLARIATGEKPRSSALSPDGTALFVVNYESDTVSRVRTSDMQVLETVDVDHHPIGITYDPVSDRVWVAAYGGSLTVFSDVS
jgi:YVTN family beta-propeller protein